MRVVKFFTEIINDAFSSNSKLVFFNNGFSYVGFKIYGYK